MKRNLLLIILICAFPVFSFAQKAYETEHYKATIQGREALLNLANGYIGATKIILKQKSKSVSYSPESGAASEKYVLRCNVKGHTDYFVLNHVKELFTPVPRVVTGTYYIHKQAIPVKFHHVK